MDYDIKTILSNSISYQDYYDEVEQMVKMGKTSGSIQSEALVEYTKLNFKRMKRLNKTAAVNPELTELVENTGINMHWLIITEAWCGDAAQNIPYLAKLGNSASNVKLSLVYRDEHPELMADYLTNESKSIPKLAIFDESFEPLAAWGPRPAEVQEMVMNYKNQLDPKPNFDDFAASVHKWYNANKNQMLEQELFSIFRKVNLKSLAS
jgi:hypothetical protein